MKRLITAICIAAGLTIPTPGDAQTLYTCGDGRVRGVETVLAAAAAPASAGEADGTDRPGRISAAGRADASIGFLVTVQLENVVYTARSSADVPWNLDPTVLEPGREIYVCANNQQLVLDRHDGTDYRATIVRAKRVPAATVAAGPR